MSHCFLSAPIAAFWHIEHLVHSKWNQVFGAPRRICAKPHLKVLYNAATVAVDPILPDLSRLSHVSASNTTLYPAHFDRNLQMLLGSLALALEVTLEGFNAGLRTAADLAVKGVVNADLV